MPSLSAISRAFLERGISVKVVKWWVFLQIFASSLWHSAHSSGPITLAWSVGCTAKAAGAKTTASAANPRMRPKRRATVLLLIHCIVFIPIRGLLSDQASSTSRSRGRAMQGKQLPAGGGSPGGVL